MYNDEYGAFADSESAGTAEETSGQGEWTEDATREENDQVDPTQKPGQQPSTTPENGS